MSGFLRKTGAEAVSAALASASGAQLVGFKVPEAGGVLRQVAASLRDVFNVKNFGALGNGVDDDTVAIQATIDAAHAAGGGAVLLPDGTYKLSASKLGETYDNAGAAISSALCALVLRKRVSLFGSGVARCKLFTSDENLIIVGQVAPEGSTVAGIDIGSTWVPGSAGSGHGIFVLSTAGAADKACKDVTWRDMLVHNVGSYAIGLQSGSPNGCRIEAVTVDTIGADALDLKARSDVATEPSGNHCSNVTVRNHGRRVAGSAGIDVRGIWHLSNVTVTDFGGDAAKDFFGIRFRTKPDPADAYNKAGARSSLTGFYVKPTAGAAALATYGVVSGSDDVHVVNGVVDGCTEGVLINGNANGSAQRNVVVNVTAIGALSYGFRASSGTAGITFNACTSVGAVTAGFRNEGTRTTYIACASVTDTATLSTAGTSAPTELIIGCQFGTEYGMSMYSPAAGRTALEAKGASADIDIQFLTKGTGLVRFGTWTAKADVPITGYVSIRDTGGNVRKLAVID